MTVITTDRGGLDTATEREQTRARYPDEQG